MRQKKQAQFMQRFMTQKINFGGLVVTRQRAYDYMAAREYAGGTQRAIDWFVFKPDALPDDTPEYEGEIPE